jgi:hypothetical protein
MRAPILMDIDQHPALPFPRSLPEFQRLSRTMLRAPNTWEWPLR